MLDYDKTEFYKEIDINKTVCLRECMICYCYYFLKVNFKFIPKVCDCSHDMTQNPRPFMMFQFLLLKETIIGFIFEASLKGKV